MITKEKLDELIEAAYEDGFIAGYKKGNQETRPLNSTLLANEASDAAYNSMPYMYVENLMEDHKDDSEE